MIQILTIEYTRLKVIQKYAEISADEQMLINTILLNYMRKTNKGKSKRTEVKDSAKGSTFDVNPVGIDQSLFKKKRKDPQQEAMRKLILEAFRAMKRDSKYARPFKIFIP